MWKKENSFALLVGMPLREVVWRYLKKLEMDLPFDPEMPFLAIYLKECKTLIWKNVSTPMFIAALFTIPGYGISHVPISRWVDKIITGHWHNGILLSCKKEENFILFLRKRFYLLIFGQRERERGREGEKHQCVVASPVPAPRHTGDLACNPGMCPDWESNQRHFGWQAGTQSPEPHQPRRKFYLLWQYGWAYRTLCKVK